MEIDQIGSYLLKREREEPVCIRVFIFVFSAF
jgi:hypothetical protein